MTLPAMMWSSAAKGDVSGGRAMMPAADSLCPDIVGSPIGAASPPGNEGPETLAGRTAEGEHDAAVGQAGAPWRW